MSAHFAAADFAKRTPISFRARDPRDASASTGERAAAFVTDRHNRTGLWPRPVRVLVGISLALAAWAPVVLLVRLF